MAEAMRSNYVHGASVTSSAFQKEIRAMLTAAGVRDVSFASDHERPCLRFHSLTREFRLVLPAPRTAPGSKAGQEATRQCWRLLSVLVRAKLDAVAAGLVTFDQEFLAYVVVPGGGTVFQATAPGIAAAYDAGQAPHPASEAHGGRADHPDA